LERTEYRRIKDGSVAHLDPVHTALLKPGDRLELKPDTTDITDGVVEIKVISIEDQSVRLESVSSSGVPTPIHMALGQVEAVFQIKRASE
jgi:hypothetical protein